MKVRNVVPVKENVGIELLHVTAASAAESILRFGFEPRIGPRSTELGEAVSATVFFNTVNIVRAFHAHRSPPTMKPKLAQNRCIYV